MTSRNSKPLLGGTNNERPGTQHLSHIYKRKLAALEQGREKTRAFKQAMMQEVFAGKTRLI